MQRERGNIARMVIINEVLENIKGLAYECRNLAHELGIPDVMMNKVSKGTIKNALEAKNKEEKRQEMENSKKVGDRLTDNPHDNSYLSEMSLHKSRIWIRHRARMLKGVKYNIKRSYKDLSCRFCDTGEEETCQKQVNSHLNYCIKLPLLE